MRLSQKLFGRSARNRGEHAGRKSPWRSLIVAGVAAAVVSALVVSGVVVTTNTSVQAASHGAGYDIGEGWLGSYVAADGRHTYCLEINKSPATAGGTYYERTGGWGSLNADWLAKLNWAIANFGENGDPNWGSAVAMYVWSIADNGAYNGNGMSGDSYYIARAPSGARGDILAKLNNLRSWGNGVAADQNSGGSGAFTWDVDSLNNYYGSVTVTSLSPADAVGTVTLTNGKFRDTGQTTRSGVRNGQVLPIVGTPTDADATFEISATGTFTSPTGNGYQGNINVYQTGAAQHTAGRGGRSGSSFTVSGSDPVPRRIQFSPVVTTAVSTKYVDAGAKPDDKITFDTTGAIGWRRVGALYRPVTAKGTLYGPFASEPTRSNNIPAGSPVAGHATVTTTTADGPTVAYPVKSDTAVTNSGYYTWVWSVNIADQSAATALYITPGWSFRDDFGIPAETAFAVPGFSTDALDETTPGSTINDTVTVTGVVPSQGIKVTFEGFQQAADWDDTFASVCTPANRVYVSTTPTTFAAGDGTFTKSSESFPVNMSHANRTIVWVATAKISNTQVWKDTCGANPAERTKVSLPTVTTDAVDQTNPGSTINDTVTVTGFLPPEGIKTTFEAFRQDPHGDGTPVCAPENLVFASTVSSDLSAAGTTSSEVFDVLMTHVRATADDDDVTEVTFYWVETSTIGGLEVHKGTCGEPTEKTVVNIPVITTDAEPFAVPFSTVRDNVHVAGFVGPEGLNVTFRGFHQDTAGTPICDVDENMVYKSTTPHHMTVAGDVVSEDFAVTSAENGDVFWSEEVYVNDTLIHEGVCGTPTEITKVQPPSLETLATPGFVGEEAYDHATVTGLVPEGSYLTFSLYQEMLGEEGTATETEEFLANPDWADQKFPITGADRSLVGQELNEQLFEVDSDHVLVDSLGTFLWVAHVWTADGELIVKGTLGEESETTSLNKSRVKGIQVLEFSGWNASSLPFYIMGIGVLALLVAAAAVITAFIQRRRRLTRN